MSRLILADDQMLQAVLTVKWRDHLLGLVNAPVFSSTLRDDEQCHHVTLYHPLNRDANGSPSPFDALDEGERVIVHVLGRVRTAKVDAIIVSVEVPKLAFTFMHQAGGKRRLHVTLGCADGIKPVESNDAISAAEASGSVMSTDITDMQAEVKITEII